MSELNAEQISIIVNPDYVPAEGISLEDISDNLASQSWETLISADSHQLVGMGTSTHEGIPTSLALGIPSREKGKYALDVFAKPAYSAFSLNEFNVTPQILERGINVPPIIARMVKLNAPRDVVQDSIIITELIHTAQALSVRDLSFASVDTRSYGPEDLTAECVSAISDLHNLGIIHKDLHLGNIGYQFEPGRRAKIIFFDFETSTVLDNDLLLKKTIGKVGLDQQDICHSFEFQAAHDLAFFAAHLKDKGIGLSTTAMHNLVIAAYLETRMPSYGRMSRHNLTTEYKDHYQKLVVSSLQ